MTALDDEDIDPARWDEDPVMQDDPAIYADDYWHDDYSEESFA